jgi:hypothetical protein
LIMKKFGKFGCLVLLAFNAISVSYAEILGRMSDDTEPLTPSTPSSTTQNNRQIIYRVICPEGTEVLPDCEQAPVVDALEKVHAPVEGEPEKDKTAKSAN